MEYQPEPFLRDSWNRDNDMGLGREDQENSAHKIFRQIELDASRDKELLKYFEAAKKSIQRYKLVIQREKEAREGGLSAKEIEERNQIRRKTHDRRGCKNCRKTRVPQARMHERKRVINGEKVRESW